jgi:hypothetical protein
MVFHYSWSSLHHGLSMASVYVFHASLQAFVHLQDWMEPCVNAGARLVKGTTSCLAFKSSIV